MAWLPGWQYRKPLVITGGASGAQTDFQLDIDIAFVAAKMQADFDDIRFTQNDGTTLIDGWLESKVDSTSAETWVEFPTTPANTVESDPWYMYYGKADAVNYWDGPATWIDFQNFDEQGTDEVATGWTDWVGTPRTSDAQSHSGSISLQFVGATGAYRSFTNIITNNDRRIMFFIRKETSTSELATFLGGTQYYDIHLSIRDTGGIDLEYYTTAWNDTEHNATLAAWKKMEFNNIDFTNNQVDWYYDGVLVKENMPFRISTNNLDSLRIHNSSGTSYFDDICVGKYAANPPTYAFGAEESAPTEGNPFWYYDMLRRRN